MCGHICEVGIRRMHGASNTFLAHHLTKPLLSKLLSNNNIQNPFRDSAMSVFKPACLWFLLSLTVATIAYPDHELQSLHLKTIKKRELGTFNLHKRCYGSCEECFGQGYQECASSLSLCFKPGDPQHGEEACSSSGTTDSTVPTTPIIDYCAQGDCALCFGAGATECPGSTSQCYMPGDSESGIESCSSSDSDSSGTKPSASSDLPTPSASSDSSSTSGSNITNTEFCDNGGFDCKRCLGSTYIPCPDAPNSYCYDPNNSTSICPDGTLPAGDSGSSSGSESAAESGSATDTASTSPTTADTDSTTETFAATDTSYTATNDIGGTTSSTFSSSRTSSAGGISQTSATSGNANGNPINATSNGQPTVGEGMFGALTVLTVCFTSFFGLVF
jgi:hypothetical protein